MPLFFITYEQHGVSYLMCSQAGRVCWLCAALLLYPATPFSSPTPLCVCLMPCPLRNGTGQPLRSGEVFRSQTPFEKALFPPVQKQISGLPCWDQVYVSVSPPAVCVVWQPCSRRGYLMHSYLKNVFLEDMSLYTVNTKQKKVLQ